MSVGFGSSARVASPQTTHQDVIPAPVGGMDARIPAAQQSQNTALLLYNLVPGEFSLQVRSGYRVWAEDVNDLEVRSIIPFSGVEGLGAGDKLFAATEEGIWDVTDPLVASTLEYAFPNSGPDAGFGVYTHYVNDIGANILFYADGANGLIQYDPLTGLWTIPTGITVDPAALTPFDVANVSYIVSHKLRIWMVQKDSNVGWYLPIVSQSGEVKEFLFASKFKHGGSLVGLFNWSIDGGDGVDDYLVAVSRAGDVIPFRGEDPASSATWQNVGTFYIGDVPRGNRVASEYGGELYLLSTFGIMSMKDLLQGAEAGDVEREGSVGFKIASLLRDDLKTYNRDHGWNIKFVTNEGMLMVSTPQLLDGTFRQYVYNISTQGWGIWRDVPLLTSDPWEGALMIGSPDGRVLRMDVTSDDVQLDGTGATEIKFFVLTSYSTLGTPATFKRLTFIRPNWLANLPPSYDVFSYYDYEITEELAPIASATPQVSVWNTDLWNVGLWTGDGLLPASSLRGGGGMGRACAVGMTGLAKDGGRLVSWDIAWNDGGFL